MPLTGKGEKILEHLEAEYGAEKGKSVLYAGKNAGTFSGIDALADAVAAMCDRFDDACARRDAEDVKRFHRYGGTQSEDPSKENYYNASAVQQAIEASNRAGRRIGKGEAKLIHSLMQGWRGRADAVTSPDYALLMQERDRAVKAYGSAHSAWKEGKLSAKEFLAARNVFDQETIDFDRAYAKQAGWLPTGWLTRSDATDFPTDFTWKGKHYYATGKKGTNRASGEKSAEYESVDKEGHLTGDRVWRTASGETRGDDHRVIGGVHVDANSPAYEAALSAFKTASAKFREAQRAYRAKEISDAAFLAAKAEYSAAEREMDRATPAGH